MIQEFFTLEILTSGQKLYEFTDKTIEWINKLKIKNGILNLSIQHTSASLIVQENDDNVRTIPLYASEDVQKVNLFKSLFLSFNYMIWGDV